MFKRSLLTVILVFLVTFALGFWFQWQQVGALPSRYDPGVTIDTAFKTAKTPLLVEFYSDTCGRCRQVTPLLHKTATHRLKSVVTLVMLDVDNPDNEGVATLFGVKTLPAVFVFDPKKMKKHALSNEVLDSETLLTQAIQVALKPRS
jgi:thiol:disulfide interchange protein